MERTCVILAGMAMLAAVGCQEDRYRVHVTPTDHAFDRSIKLFPHGANTGDDAQALRSTTITDAELTGVAAVYNATADSREFGARFEEYIPADIQGAGFLTSVSDQFGMLGFYVERPRGQRDVVASLDRVRSAQDLIVQLAIDDARERFADEAWRDDLLDVIDRKIRPELEAIGLEMWAMNHVLSAAPDMEMNDQHEGFYTEAGARVVARLVERGFVTPSEVISLGMAPGIESTKPDAAALLELAQSKLAKLVGAHAAPEVWGAYEAAFSDESLDPENDPSVLAWTEECGGSPFLAAFGMDGLLSNYDGVELTLKTNVEPIATNGLWNEEKGTVGWTLHVDPDRNATTWTAPTAFAVWASPDESSQQAIFGMTRLSGDELADHLLWLATRSPADQEAWRRLVDEIKPLSDQERARRLAKAGDAHPELADGVRLVRGLLEQ